MLDGVADSLVQEIQQSGAWQQMTTDAANRVYDQVRARFDADRDQIMADAVTSAGPAVQQLAAETVLAVKPQVQQTMIDIFDDAETQARIGQTREEVANTLIQVAAVSVFAGVLGTWLLVRYAGGSK